MDESEALIDYREKQAAMDEAFDKWDLNKPDSCRAYEKAVEEYQAAWEALTDAEKIQLDAEQEDQE